MRAWIAIVRMLCALCSLAVVLALMLETAHAQSCKQRRTSGTQPDSAAGNRCDETARDRTTSDQKRTMPTFVNAPTTLDDVPPSGRFASNGRTGLLPVGRIGWREVDSWRQSRYRRVDR